jgi:Zinc-binding dehydrogenase
VDTSADKLETAKKMGADEGLLSGDEAVARVKDITNGQGAELVLDLVAVNPTLAMAAQMARALGHLTIVGVGTAALPVNFSNPPHECSVASPFWGSIPELMESSSSPKRKDPDARRTLSDRPRRRGLPAPSRRQNPRTRRHHTQQLTEGSAK